MGGELQAGQSGGFLGTTSGGLGGGSGTIAQITSTDGSVGITNPAGPITDLSVSGFPAVPDQRVMGNISGGAAQPAPLTRAQILTFLGLTAYGDERAAALIRAQALCGSTLTVLTGTECDALVLIGATSSSFGGSVDMSSTDGGGVVSIKSGAGVNGQGFAKMSGNPTLVHNLVTSKFYTIFRGKFVTAGDGASNMDFELVPSGAGNSLIAIGQAGGISTTFFRIRILDSAGNSLVNAVTTVPLNVGVYHTIEMWNDLVNVYVAIDGTIVRTQAVGTFAGGDPMTMGVVTNCGVSAVNRQIDLDRMYTVVVPN